MASADVDASAQATRGLYQAFMEKFSFRTRPEDATAVKTDNVETQRIPASAPSGDSEVQIKVPKSVVTGSETQSEDRQIVDSKGGNDDEQAESPKAVKSKHGTESKEHDKSPEKKKDKSTESEEHDKSSKKKKDKSTESEEHDKSPKKKKDKSGKKKEIVSSSTVFPRLEVCQGKKCKKAGSEALLADFQKAGEGKVEIAYTKCMKQCDLGMNVRMTQDGSTFEFRNHVSSTDVQPILCQHFDW